MGEGTKDVTGMGKAGGDETSSDTAAIRAEIEQKRADISDTLDEIQDRLTPRNLVSQATDTVREKIANGVRHVRSGSAGDAAGRVARSTRQAALRTAEQAREHPWSAAAAVASAGAVAWWLATRSGADDVWDLDDYSEESLYFDEDVTFSNGNGGVGSMLKTGTLPVVLAGAAVGWWLWRRQSGAGPSGITDTDDEASWNGGAYGSAGADAGSYRTFEGDRRWREERGTATRMRGALAGAASRARHAASAATERTRQVAGQAQQRLTDSGREAASQVERWVDDNPLAAGAAALLVGFVLGLAIPESDRERRMLSGARGRLINSARQAGRDAVGRARQTLVDAARQRA